MVTLNHEFTREENSKGGLTKHQRHLERVRMSFESRDLLRVREQIEIACKAFKAATEPMDIFRLSSALSKLREDERKLAGRPDPGSYRPTAPKSKPAKSSGPVEE